jgi:hypothetical protein
VITAAFRACLHIPNADSVELFIRLHLNDHGRRRAQPRHRRRSSTHRSPGDVTVSPASTQVSFGTPAPETRTLSMVEFFVTSFTPVRDNVDGGADITIVGSGFMTPLIVRIGGVQVAGTSHQRRHSGDGPSSPAGSGPRPGDHHPKRHLPVYT